jgi:hypothetical protein
MLTGSAESRIQAIAEEEEGAGAGSPNSRKRRADVFHSRKRRADDDSPGPAEERRPRAASGKGAKRAKGEKKGKSTAAAVGSAALASAKDEASSADASGAVTPLATPMDSEMASGDAFGGPGSGAAAAAAAALEKGMKKARKPAKGSPSSIPGTPTEGMPDDPKRPRAVTSSYWSIAERNEFLRALSVVGKDWENVAASLTSKSAAQARNYFSRNAVDVDFAEAAALADQNSELPLEEREKAAQTLALRRKAAAEAEGPRTGYFAGPGGMSLDSAADDSGPRGLRINSLLNDDTPAPAPAAKRAPSAVPDWFGGRDGPQRSASGHDAGDDTDDEDARPRSSAGGRVRTMSRPATASGHETAMHSSTHQGYLTPGAHSQQATPPTPQQHVSHLGRRPEHTHDYFGRSASVGPAAPRSAMPPPPSAYNAPAPRLTAYSPGGMPAHVRGDERVGGVAGVRQAYSTPGAMYERASSVASESRTSNWGASATSQQQRAPQQPAPPVLHSQSPGTTSRTGAWHQPSASPSMHPRVTIDGASASSSPYGQSSRSGAVSPLPSPGVNSSHSGSSARPSSAYLPSPGPMRFGFGSMPKPPSPLVANSAQQQQQQPPQRSPLSRPGSSQSAPTSATATSAPQLPMPSRRSPPPSAHSSYAGYQRMPPQPVQPHQHSQHSQHSQHGQQAQQHQQYQQQVQQQQQQQHHPQQQQLPRPSSPGARWSDKYR